MGLRVTLSGMEGVSGEGGMYEMGDGRTIEWK